MSSNTIVEKVIIGKFVFSGGYFAGQIKAWFFKELRYLIFEMAPLRPPETSDAILWKILFFFIYFISALWRKFSSFVYPFYYPCKF
jgi:hypothetical protein